MSYIALYRKWRPSVFEDVVEQEHVVRTLKHCVNTGHIAHAYLFCGTRGTGKTTMAHILSRAINCISPVNGNPCNSCEICRGILSGSLLDVIEIDAASNNSVDNIRDIREEVVYTPSQAKYKVYIIDEVHMLSTGAFNALLKTLEEPPAHIVFILATTEPHKLPATILSRCQRFDFRRITSESIVSRLEVIADSSQVTVEPAALKLIARLAEGAMRDAISLLDQCISSGGNPITHKDVLSIVGIVNEEIISNSVKAVKERNVAELMQLVERLVMDGKDITKFLSDLILHYRNLLICKMSGDPSEVIDALPEALEVFRKQSEWFGKDEIIYVIRYLSGLEAEIKWSAHPRILLEVALIKLSEGIVDSEKSDLSERISVLERKVANGVPLQAQVMPTPALEIKTAPSPAEAPAKPKEQTSGAIKTKPIEKGKNLEKWTEILNEIKAQKKMALYSYLLEARAIEVDDRRTGLVFPEKLGLCKMMVSKTENLDLLQKAAFKVLGRETVFRCMDENELDDRKAAKEEVSDPSEEKAREIAALLDVKLNIIDS